MANHKSVVSAECHEPKHVTNAVVGDAGKVLTPSASVAGTSELRNLTESEILSVTDTYTVHFTDVSAAGSVWVPVESAGTITSIKSVLYGALTVADEVVDTYISGVGVTNGSLTLAYTGSAAGDIDTATPTGNNAVTSSQAIELRSQGLSTGPQGATFIVTVQRT